MLFLLVLLGSTFVFFYLHPGEPNMKKKLNKFLLQKLAQIGEDIVEILVKESVYSEKLQLILLTSGLIDVIIHGLMRFKCKTKYFSIKILCRYKFFKFVNMVNFVGKFYFLNFLLLIKIYSLNINYKWLKKYYNSIKFTHTKIQKTLQQQINKFKLTIHQSIILQLQLITDSLKLT